MTFQEKTKMTPPKFKERNRNLRWYLSIVLFLFLLFSARTKSGDTLDYWMPHPYHPTPNSWHVVWEKAPDNLLFSLIFGLFVFTVTKPFVKK